MPVGVEGMRFAPSTMEVPAGNRLVIELTNTGTDVTVYGEGAYRLGGPGHAGGDPTGGAQVLPLVAAQGGFVELTFPEPGRYPFVSHAMVDAERGAHGFFEVTE